MTRRLTGTSFGDELVADQIVEHQIKRVSAYRKTRHTARVTPPGEQQRR